MPSFAHEAVIEKILGQYPEAKTGKFIRNLRAAIPDAEDGFLGDTRVRPDAYWIDHEHQTILAIEVEVESPLTDAKLALYAELYWRVSDCDWDLVLKTVNRFGQQSGLVDMADVALARVVDDARKSGRNPQPGYVEFVEQCRALL